MSRAYLVYILMFLLAGGGLWVIFTLGSAVRAPDDLSGEWAVAWDGPPPPMKEPGVMRVTQSGRFFTVQLGSAAPVSMKLNSPWHGARDGRTLEMHLSGDVWKLDVSGDIELNMTQVPAAHLELSGLSRHVGEAQRRRADGTLPTTRPKGLAVRNGAARGTVDAR